MGKTSLDASPLVIHEDGTPFPGEDHPAPKVLATGKPVRDVVMGFYRPAVKDRAWLLVNADPQLGPDGRVEQVSALTTSPGFATDRALARERRRYRQLVEKRPTSSTGPVRATSVRHPRHSPGMATGQRLWAGTTST